MAQASRSAAIGTDSSVTRAFARDNRGVLVSKSPSAGEYYFYLFDGLGSVAAVTDPSGNVAANYQYDPYGNVTSQTGTIYNPFQYASGWQSNITNFTHFGQRWYAPIPEYGRWTQQDPVAGSLGNPISQCRYAYANDDPMNLTRIVWWRASETDKTDGPGSSLLRHTMMASETNKKRG